MVEKRALVERILAGDQYAFEQLVRDYQKLVSHIVFRMIANPADREDICQEVFMRVYKNLKSFRYDSKLSTWIARIAYNGCLNYLEKKKVPLYDDIIEDDSLTIENQADQAPSPDMNSEDFELSKILNNEIEKLPVRYRTILTLYHLDEMSYDEIGKVTDQPSGTVKSYLFRARKMLKKRLEMRYNREDLWR
jgi:RNA polymerase sigma-70 factor (ECF subfamily)